jgi:hypothetical protein
MEKSTPRRMAARSWLLLLCFAAAATTGMLQAHAQLDSVGTFSPSDPTTECMMVSRAASQRDDDDTEELGAGCVLLQVSSA